MNIITLILIIFAFVLFMVAAAGVTHPRWNFIALGLALYMASLFASTIVHAQTQSPRDVYLEKKAEERQEREMREGMRLRSMDRREDRIEERHHDRWCREVRRKAEFHPEIAVPRECWR